MIEELSEIAWKFRHAIENAREAGEYGELFIKFPDGQCGNVSDLLSQYLNDLGYESVYYVNGTFYDFDNEDSQSHTWLEVKGIIIDITGDQFRQRQEPLKCDVPVYVGPIDEWHKIFDTSHGSYYIHTGLQETWFIYAELKRWYETILTFLDNTEK